MKNHELVAPPEPDQMFKIAAVVMSLATSQNKVKKSNTHFFLPFYHDSVEFNGGQMKAMTHSFLGRVARHGLGCDRTWTMRLVEKSWTIEDYAAGTLRTTNMFAWNANDVLQADRILQRKEGSAKTYTTEDLLADNMVMYPSLMHGTEQMHTISKADCKELISDLRQFSAASPPVLQYNR